MNAKFEFTGEVNALGLKRIRAKIAIGISVKAGDLGGWIENEDNVAPTGDAWVYGNAWVSGNAWVYGDAHIFVVGPVGSRDAYLTATVDAKIGIRISTGCFSGSLSEFRAEVKKTHGADSFHGRMYMGIANLIALKFNAEIEA